VNKVDPITSFDIVTVILPLLSAMLAVIGVLFSIYFANRREVHRQEHERLLKDAELAETRADRLRDERVKRLVYEGMCPRWARAEVYGGEDVLEVGV
jgi:hypothetical protein